jgi:lysophospholipase L1-like esterase
MTNLKKLVTSLAVLIVIVFAGMLLEGIYNEDFCLKLKSLTDRSYSYLDNPYYKKRIDFFSVDTSQKDIVMLGNSQTSRADWNELLTRDDIANRGIGSDITEGYLNRMDNVLNLNPKICFIEGGVNDIAKGIPADETINNLSRIIDTLTRHNITPVLTTVTLVGENYRKSESFNQKIKELNIGINILATEKGVTVIDLNPLVSDGNKLKQEFADQDGIHFMSKAYLIWRDELMKILNCKGI